MSKWPKITLKSRWGRLVLVPPAQEDDVEVASLRSDPVTLKYVPFLPKSITAEQWAAKRETNAKNDEIWNFHIHLMPEPASGVESRFVGQCGIMDINPVNQHAELGILVSPNQHRTGIATEAIFLLLSHAFEYPELKLHRVVFETGAHNVQMRGWFEKFGVEVEHRLRDAWTDGKGGWLDSVGYSILDSEWPELKTRLEKWLDARIPS